MIDLSGTTTIHFIGVGGVGMSAAASLAKEKGFTVTGSDSKELYEPAKSALEAAAIDVSTPYDASHIGNADLYIISSGEDLKNPEVAAVYEKNLPHCSFAELLGKLYEDSIRIVVAGTHGKSTTTGLLGSVLHAIDGSTYFTGGVLQGTDTNSAAGHGHYAVFEGDEYRAEWDDPTPKFHYLKPDVLVLTNLEHDHPDLFPTFEDMEREFELLVENLPEDGLVVYNADDVNLEKIVRKAHVPMVSYSVHGPSDYQVTDITHGQFTAFAVPTEKNPLGERYQTQLPGDLNVYNCLAVVTALRSLGFQYNQLALEIAAFRGIKRRFEEVGESGGVTYVDDYAHHPTAIKETLKAAKQRYPGRRLWAVFEPHTYSRTKELLSELSTAFEDADEVVLSHIYAAREKNLSSLISSEEVLEQVKKHKANAQLVDGPAQAAALLKAQVRSGDVVVVMGVGSFSRLADSLVEAS